MCTKNFIDKVFDKWDYNEFEHELSSMIFTLLHLCFDVYEIMIIIWNRSYYMIN